MRRTKRHDDIYETPDVSHIQNPDVAHESSDVSVRGILWFTLGLFILFILTIILMRLMFTLFEDRARKLEENPAPMALSEKDRLPPPPRLQSAPGFGVDIEKEKAKEFRESGYVVENDQRVNLELREPQAELRVLQRVWDEELKNGYVDPNTGERVGIPIEEAKKRLIAEAATRLRTRAQDNTQQNISQGGMDLPSFSSSGRRTEKRDQ